MLLCSQAFGSACGKHEYVQVEAGKVSRKQSEEFVEHFDMGEGRFVEKRGARQLIVGAKDDAEADVVVEEWKAEVLRRALEVENRGKEVTPEELAEQEARRRAAEEEAARLAEEERKKREDEARRKAEQEEEAKRKEEEAKKRKEELMRWLRAHGFTGVNDKREKETACCGCACSCGRDNHVYPLHIAAELADARIVELLLEEGADRTTTSSGRTPAQVALKHNKSGSHDAVLRLLRSEGGKPRSGGA